MEISWKSWKIKEFLNRSLLMIRKVYILWKSVVPAYSLRTGTMNIWFLIYLRKHFLRRICGNFTGKDGLWKPLSEAWNMRFPWYIYIRLTGNWLFRKYLQSLSCITSPHCSMPLLPRKKRKPRKRKRRSMSTKYPLMIFFLLLEGS